jgi:hypothetical protein
MVLPPHLTEFLLAAFVLIFIPGPSVLFVVSRGVALGRRAALLTVLGNAGGLVVQGSLLAAGARRASGSATWSSWWDRVPSVCSARPLRAFAVPPMWSWRGPLVIESVCGLACRPVPRTPST